MNAAQYVKEAILKEIPSGKIDVMELDLSSMEFVRKFASEFNSSGILPTPENFVCDGSECPAL
ncbi:hypothetical protein Ahy_B05g073947 [Arachis hypogaea]|uniref:Uncharacterized protein n=1 Tax=Arachis hypogaea TaxID=3818 RepID=A0A444YXH2_ARAHY|nr:hypothetical protein Ahy_B05g073947 [Arachis hypogaea]